MAVVIDGRWSIEQVVALARTPARFGAGESVAVPASWSHLGASSRGVWGRYHGRGAEPYEVAADHERVLQRCTCPSRQQPCKHVVGLLVLWVRGQVPEATEPADVVTWLDRERRRAEASRGDSPAQPTTDVTPDAGTGDAGVDPQDRVAGEPPSSSDRDAERDERVARLVAGLVELDRWLEDRLRTGLADPSIARFGTWDALAARLVDARAGALANRVRRLAGRVGAAPDWHEGVLADIGVLHLLAQAGQRVPALPPPLADSVATACGWQVRRADVEASAPVTDRWLVIGRSDVREDLVEVRRTWLRGLDSGATAMVLSFAAYRQSLDASLPVGTVTVADLHRYPGAGGRALVGERYGDPRPVGPGEAVEAGTLSDALAEVGRALAREPWSERVPVVVRAAPTLGGGAWALGDHTGSLPIATERSDDSVAVLLAASGGHPVAVSAEWTASGLVPLAVFLPDRVLDIGPRADASFVSAA
jgi:hypothetical protein